MKLRSVPILRRLVPALFAAIAAFGVLASNATAAIEPATVTLASPGVSPGQGEGFGLYNFTVAHGGPNVFPFSTGAKRGHCVEATVSAASGPATLEADGDANLAPSAEANNRVAWLMLSTLYNQDTADASALTLDQRASAHQSATWQITDPGLPQTISSDPAVEAEANRLLAESDVNKDAAQQAPSIVAPAAAAPCGAGTRGIQVAGAPFSSAELTISSVNGTFTGGGKTISLDLGPTGTATTEVTAAVGAVEIAGTVQQGKLVYADFPATQDFAYAETSPTPVRLTIDFPSCTTSPGTPTPGTPATGATPAPGGPAAGTPTGTTPAGQTPGSSTAVANSRAKLRLTKRGAKKVRAGRKTTVILKVTNTSKTIARNVVLSDRLPKGVVISRRTLGMTVRGRQISIRIGSLGPGRMVTRRVVVSVLRSTPQGRRCSYVTVRSSNAATRRASCCMAVIGDKRKVLPAVTG